MAGAGDFNGDSQSDILWQNTLTGQRVLWLMDGVNYAGYVDLGIMPVDWQIAGTGDFNGDSQSDILWQNTTTGQRVVWLMNGTNYAGSVDLGTVDPSWEIKN